MRIKLTDTKSIILTKQEGEQVGPLHVFAFDVPLNRLAVERIDSAQAIINYGNTRLKLICQNDKIVIIKEPIKKMACHQ